MNVKLTLTYVDRTEGGYFYVLAKMELDIEEYSFSQTTLEQVFLKFSHYDEVNGSE